MTKLKIALLSFILTVFCVTATTGFLLFDEFQRRERFSGEEAKSLIGVQRVAEFISEWQRSRTNTGQPITPTGGDLSQIAAALAPFLHVPLPASPTAAPTPVAPAPATGVAAPAPTPPPNPKEQLKDRYKNFNEASTFSGRQNPIIATMDTQPLLTVFLLNLGAVASSLGTLYTLVRGRFAIAKDLDYFRLFLQPLFGSVTCVVAGLVIHFATSKTAHSIAGLNLDYSFISIPAPIFLISFVLSINPLNTLHAFIAFLRTHSQPFAKEDQTQSSK